MKRIFLYIGVIMLGLGACTTSTHEKDKTGGTSLAQGAWRGILNTQGIEIPFNFTVSVENGQTRIELINAEERLPLNQISIAGDSIHIPLYIFDATIHARILSNSELKGVWIKNYAEDYVIPFEASAGNAPRFSSMDDTSASSFEGKWEVDFLTEDGANKAIGLFKQSGNMLTGTFLTPTGDYRFLEGVAEGNRMRISCFDGTHAYRFDASLDEDGELQGDFWSGKTWHQKWTAVRNDEFELPDPYSMTVIKDGYETFEISFPNTSDQLISLNDERYKDKVVVLQILGTWCPNCMDETRFYVDWLQRNKDRGVEIIGLAFERKPDKDYAIRRIENMKEKLGVNYEVLIAGSLDSASRAEALPMLNKIMSFPTSIILDKQHKVRKIHTGFSGPGTGEYYGKFVEEFGLMMDKLLSE